MVKCTKYAYICVQCVKISKNRHFVFRFTSLPVLTIFQPSFSTRSWWRKTLNFKLEPSNSPWYRHTKFQENRIKIVAVTVPLFFRSKWRPWRHQLCYGAKRSMKILKNTTRLFVQIFFIVPWICNDQWLCFKSFYFQFCWCSSVILTVVFIQMHKICTTYLVSINRP